MRRTKKAVLELPEKIYQTHEVSLEEKQRQMYDGLRKQLYLEITTLDGEQVVDDAENILKTQSMNTLKTSFTAGCLPFRTYSLALISTFFGNLLPL